jgi:hypothetical protein
MVGIRALSARDVQAIPVLDVVGHVDKVDFDG